jgi:hypothetical protein
MNFDLNIENYNKDELREMFNLPINYETTIVKKNEANLRDMILNNNEITKETQTQTLNFLVKAKNILLNNLNENEGNKEFKEKVFEFINSSYELKPVTIENSSDHVVQVRKERPFLSSYPSEYFPGIINPLKRRTIKQNLNIDSRFRENYYNSASSNFNITLPMIINNIYTMQLSSIELPSTFYVVSKQYGNNFFSVTINGTTDVVNVPEGNYDTNGIVAAINNQLKLLGGNFANIEFVIDLTNNSGSARTLVGLATGSTEMIFELNFQADRFGNDDKSTPLPLKFGWLLGFRNGIYADNENYVSESVVNLNGPNYLYLVVDDFNNNVNKGFYSAFNSSILNNNVLSRISLNQIKNYGLVTQNNLNIVTTPREYFGPVNLTNLNIQLLDEYGRIVDLNFQDFSFCLTLTLQYDI